ncbi:MAG: cupredoxin domain-containing protein [Candidatus Paceibacteria bacterium]
MQRNYLYLATIVMVLILSAVFGIFYLRRAVKEARQPQESPVQVFNVKLEEPVEIVIKNYTFMPSRQRVVKGQKVVWRNLDNVPHTVTSMVLGGQHVLEPGATFTFETDRLLFEGEITYRCDFHKDMSGTLAVLKEANKLSDFAKFFLSQDKETQDCIKSAYGERFDGFFDGTILVPTQEEQAAYQGCFK